MAALRITDRTTQFSCSGNGGELEEEKEEVANLDLCFYLSKKQESVADEEESSNNLLSAVDEVRCGEPTRQLPALRQLRRIYSFENDHINAQLVPLLVDCLAGKDSTQLQYEAARMLRYLARDEPAVLIENGAVPYLSDLLSSPSEDVQEQAVRAMAVVAEQAHLSFDARAITEDIIFNLLPFFYHPKSPFQLFWFALISLVYIIRCKPIEDTVVALPTLKELLETGEDTQVQRLACEALSYFSQGHEGAEYITVNDICPCLVELLFHDSPRILLYVMETMANIARYGNYKEVINDRALSRIVAILSSVDKRELNIVRLSMTGHSRVLWQLHKEICRLVACITTLTQDDIEVLIKTGVIYELVRLLAEAADGLKEEAAVAIVNGITYGNEEQVGYFVDLDCINLLSNLITPTDRRLAQTCLDGVERMLKLTKVENKHPHLFRSTKLAAFIKTQTQSNPTSCLDQWLDTEYCGLLFPPARKPRTSSQRMKFRVKRSN